VDGVQREATLVIPESSNDSKKPVVFAFHGHGGTMQNALRSFAFEKHWPEAIVVYMQGLKTPGKLTDPEGKKNGWQSGPGDQGDRDLKFFDAVLKTLKADYQIDEQRIYSTGHSNGGGFTYLLWLTRGELFAAMAPSASAAGSIREQRSQVVPKPILHADDRGSQKDQWLQRRRQALGISRPVPRDTVRLFERYSRHHAPPRRRPQICRGHLGLDRRLF
jgi:polyhydroxybutyrate depolymerase